MSAPMNKTNKGQQTKKTVQSLEKKNGTQQKRNEEIPTITEKNKNERKKNPTQPKMESKTLPKDGVCTSSKSDVNPSSNESAPNEQKIGNCDAKRISYATACKQMKPTVDKSLNQPEDRICFMKEIDQYLFNLPRDVALAHCVAEDLRMGAGIAGEFKRYFGGVGQLIDQNLSVGNVGVVTNDRNETAFYLIAKKYSGGRPTLQTLSETLKALLAKMKELHLTKLGIPKIGCDSDGLDWVDVKKLIASIFAGSRIVITVCVPSKILGRIPPPQLRVFLTPKAMLDMEAKSDILLFIDLEQFKKNNCSNDTVDKVNAKYPTFKEKLLADIESKRPCPGDVTSYTIKTERIHCLFTSPTAYYSSLEKGFINIKNGIRNYRNFAVQSGPIKPADNFKHTSRMVSVLRSVVYSSELWLCGDTDQTKDKEIYEHYCRSVMDEAKLASRLTDSNRPRGSGPNRYSNAPFNNQKWKNSPPKRNAVQRK